MKIAFIGQKGIPAVSGGLEKHVEELAIKLAEMGHSVFVYVRNNYTVKELKKYESVNLVHIPSISYSFLATIHTLFKRYDIIHYQSIGSASLCFIPKFLKRKTTIISTFHYRNYIDKKWGRLAKKYLKFGEKITCTIPDATIVLKKSLRSYVFNKYKTKALYIPDGAEIKYNPCAKVLERWNLKEKKYILSATGISGERGATYLIEAFKKLEGTNKLPNNFKLVVIEDALLENESKNNIRNSANGTENIILTGNHSRSSLQQLFSHAYLFVQPFKPKNSSSYLLEAMSYGLAPLVSDDQENLETIGKSGISFHSRSEEDLEEKLAYLLNKPEEVERIGKNARERIKKEYSWNEISRKILRIYELNQKMPNKLLPRKIQAENKSYV